MRLFRCLSVLLLAAMPAASCAPRSESTRAVVLVSVPPQAWLAERLAADRADVEIMVPPGADPHVYEPTMKQMRAAARAAIYVKVGHPHFSFEQVWFGRFLAENPQMRIVDGSRGAAHRTGDPHLWTSPAVMRVMAIHVAGALAETMPEHAAEFSDRLRAVQAEIDTLDAEIRRMLAPCRGQAFLVFHPAWGYFAADYGLIQVSIEQDGKSPAPADLARTIADSRAAGVRSVFIQPQTSATSAQTVATEIGAGVVTLDPLSRDWPANMRHAARAFREALCDD